MTFIQEQIVSFYIPRVSAHHTEESIFEIFYNSWIGDVERVDFTPIINKPGFGDNINTVVQSAFVHFSKFYINDETQSLLDFINKGDSFKFRVSPKEYWILLKNTNPVPSTKLNIHQVVENARILEETVLEQCNIINKQAEQIDRIHETIYQLLGKVFNPQTETNKIDNLFNFMVFDENTNNNKNWTNDEFIDHDYHTDPDEYMVRYEKYLDGL